MIRKVTVLLTLLLLFTPVSRDLEAQAGRRIRLTRVFPALTFNLPVGLEAANDSSGRLFVLEQGGLIRVFNRNAPQSAGTFLDVSAKVLSGGERGLLGLALHPDFLTNGQFFLNYTRQPDGATVIARYQASADLQSAAEASEQVLLLVPQPFANHNGGQLAFGPDGYLYIGLGDGGGGGDPFGNAQNRTVLLGKILRIDVNNTVAGKPYAIPADNPYSGNAQGLAEEIFAFGFRNPWRFSFDSRTGRLWAADVGQQQWEEVDVVRKGGNYGWNILEGGHCYSPPVACSSRGLIKPVAEYSQAAGQAVIGGFVYRGSRLKSFRGKYFFGDFASGLIWTTTARGKMTQVAKLNGQISAFGRDQRKELYVVAYEGAIYALR